MGVIRGLRHKQLLRSDSRVPETLTIVVRLAHLAIETGVPTGMFQCPLLLRADVANITLPRDLATAATIDLILFLRFPGDSLHAAAANSPLVLLNSRSQIERSPQSKHFSLSEAAVSPSGESATVNLRKAVITSSSPWLWA